MHNRLKINVELSKRHVINDSACMEDALHAENVIEDALHEVGDCID